MKKLFIFLSLLLTIRLILLFSLPITHYLLYFPSNYQGFEKNTPSSLAADLLIFSYDRPLQLHALLESQEKFVTKIGTVNVLYLTSSSEYERGYEQVKKQFPYVQFTKESKEKKNFKQLTVDIIKNTPSPFIIFAVDDDIITAPIDIEDAAYAMVEQNAYVFIFRLGKNITSHTSLPFHTQIGNDKMAWVLQNGKRQWRYGHNVDYSMYCKQEILAGLETLPFQAPNSMEDKWNKLFYTNIGKRQIAWSLNAHKKALSYTESKITNIPLNLVNQEIQNAHLEGYPKEELLARYLNGERIDIKEFTKILPTNTHIFVHPTFITP